MSNMKRGKKNDPEIKEVDITQLLQDLSRPDDGPKTTSVRQTGTLQNIAPSKKSLPDDRVVSGPMKNQPSSPNRPESRLSPDRSGGHTPSESDGKTSRSKKQKLRMLRKLQAKQLNPVENEGMTPDESESELSDDEASRGKDDRSSKPLKNRARRNYVERTSAVTAVTPSGCGWKDTTCVLFVVLLIAVAGFLKFQEEVFGSMDHFRSESDADADFYEILGVAHSATARDIKRAYRNKVMEIHPDRHPECRDCPQKFMAATKAYEVLLDDDKRKVYDQTRGSYEPITSDYSVSLTTFNYMKLVNDSPSVWVIQVYDDLDPSCKYFASSWDIVAGSKIANELVRFGRVNVRRDRAVLSLLPIRARTYPTVIMFSRDTLPSIFSLADMSNSALKRWVEKEMPSHVNEESSYNNRYKVTISGRGNEPPTIVKSASVHFARILDFEYVSNKATKALLQLSVIDKRTGSTIHSQTFKSDDLVSTIFSIKERLVVPLTRYNLADVCAPGYTDNPIFCVLEKLDQPALANRSNIVDGTLLQHVSSINSKASFVVDLAGSRIATFEAPLGDIDDLKFRPMDQADFISTYFPLSWMEQIMSHKTSIVAGLIVAVSFLAFTKIGALNITIAVGLMSIVVGVASSQLAVVEWLRNKIR